MINTVNNYLNINPISKVGLGGALAATAAWTMAVTNPISCVALGVLSQAVVWMPNLASKCCFRKAAAPPAERRDEEVMTPELRRAIEMSLKLDDEKAPVRHRTVSRLEQANDAPLQRALAMSLQPQHAWDEKEILHALDASMANEEEDLDLVRALRDSTRLETKVKICTLTRVINAKSENDRIAEDEIIPEGFELAVGEDYYHIGNLVLSLLSNAKTERDPLGKPMSPKTLETLADRMGINSDLFTSIWFLGQDQTAPQDINPDTQASRRTNYRMCLLRDMLKERTAYPEINALRDSYLKFFNSQEVWKRLPANIASV